jgi:heme exporter protein A
MPAAPLILEVAALERRYGATIALRSVTLELGPGEVVLVAGANGAGKSTLLRCMAGLLRPTRGTIRVAGHDLLRDPAARSRVGFLSHQTMLYDDLTARENLRFAAALHRLDRVDARVRDALDAAALTPRADTRTGLLSHGTRQRLAIARATLHQPALLLLDEPFSGLDAGAADLLRDRVQCHAGAGRSVFCVTHQLGDLWAYATRVLLLDRGRLVLDQPRPDTIDVFVAQCRPLLAA